MKTGVFKRSIWALLMPVMLWGLLPLTAFAAEEPAGMEGTHGHEYEVIAPAGKGRYLFDTEGLVQLALDDVEWVNYGIQPYGTEPTYLPGVRWSPDGIFDVPYEGVTFYIKINAPYEIGIRSGETDTTLNTNYYWLNNKELTSGSNHRGYAYTIPAGHSKFIFSIANVSRDAANNTTTAGSRNPVSFLELQAAGLEIWYAPCTHAYENGVCIHCGKQEAHTVSGRVIGGGAAVSISGMELATKEDGSFVAVAPEGAFDVVVQKGGCLTYTVKNVTADEGDVVLPEITLAVGDVNGDEMINARDIGVFRKDFGKAVENCANPYTDINGDGNVNARDINVLRRNFGKSAAKDCTVEYK